MENDWLTDELMQRASNLIREIDGMATQGTIYVVSRALHLAEKRGKEEAAKIAEGNSAEFDFAKALAECRDCEHGFHSGRLHAAAAIRGS